MLRNFAQPSDRSHLAGNKGMGATLENQTYRMRKYQQGRTSINNRKQIDSKCNRSHNEKKEKENERSSHDKAKE